MTVACNTAYPTLTMAGVVASKVRKKRAKEAVKEITKEDEEAVKRRQLKVIFFYSFHLKNDIGTDKWTYCNVQVTSSEGMLKLRSN